MPDHVATSRESPTNESRAGSTSRTTPAGPRKRSDTKSNVKPAPTKSHTYSSQPAAGPSTTQSSNRAQTLDPRLPHRMDLTGSRSKSSKDAQTSRATYSTSAVSGGSIIPSHGRHGTMQSTTSPLSSPSVQSPPSNLYISTSMPTSLLGGVNDSFIDYTSPTHRSTTIRDPYLAPYAPPQTSSSHTSVNLRVHQASRAANASTSRKSSATGSDREGGHLDFKRLMSKPAFLSPSGSSIISLPSDTEPSSPSSRRAQMAAQDAARRTLITARSREGLASRGDVGELGAYPSRSGTKDAPHRTSPQASSREPEREQTSKPRVLRRKSSAHSSPPTPTAATFRASQADGSSSNSTSRASSRRPETRPSDSRVGPSLSRRVATPSAEQVHGVKLRDDVAPPLGLTPAGAVVHAYKQQEQRREELSDWNEHPNQDSLPNLSVDNVSREIEEEEESKGPYYTVFGSTSGHVVAAGGPEDGSWNMDFNKYYDRSRFNKSGTVTPSGSGSGSSGMRGLTRKVSGRFKKAAGAVKTHRDLSPYGVRSGHEGSGQGSGNVVVGKTWMPYDGRVSLHEKSASLLRPKTTSLRLSVDEFVQITAEDVRDSSPAKSVGSPAGEREEQRGHHRPKGSHKYDEREKEKHRHRDEESSPGGKIWKIMKRISTGGLRDKYRETTVPPPVPALPKDFQVVNPSRTTLDIHKPTDRDDVGETGILLSRFMQSRTSMSGVRPSTAPHRGTPRSDVSSRPSTGGKGSGSPLGNRPSTTTRSSSPMSSDIASARFFQITRSNRSSTSSYGAELPPLPSSPTHMVAQHILPPSELYRLNKDAEDASARQSSRKARKPSRSRSAPAVELGPAHSLDDTRPSLPFPPRRPATAAGKEKSSTPSPTIRSFSTDDIGNDRTPHPSVSLSMSEFGVIEAGVPPRPRRSSRRHPPPVDIISPTSSSATSPPVPLTPRTPTLSVDVHSRGPKSASTLSHHPTPRDGSHSASPTPSSQNRSPLTFRELESPRHAWSEKEKADKWDDLLERSARAGGTLHIGESALMSDSLRFSTYSEA